MPSQGDNREAQEVQLVTSRRLRAQHGGLVGRELRAGVHLKGLNLSVQSWRKHMWSTQPTLRTAAQAQTPVSWQPQVHRPMHGHVGGAAWRRACVLLWFQGRRLPSGGFRRHHLSVAPVLWHGNYPSALTMMHNCCNGADSLSCCELIAFMQLWPSAIASTNSLVARASFGGISNARCCAQQDLLA